MRARLGASEDTADLHGTRLCSRTPAHGPPGSLQAAATQRPDRNGHRCGSEQDEDAFLEALLVGTAAGGLLAGSRSWETKDLILGRKEPASGRLAWAHGGCSERLRSPRRAPLSPQFCLHSVPQLAGSRGTNGRSVAKSFPGRRGPHKVTDGTWRRTEPSRTSRHWRRAGRLQSGLLLTLTPRMETVSSWCLDK